MMEAESGEMQLQAKNTKDCQEMPGTADTELCLLLEPSDRAWPC